MALSHIFRGLRSGCGKLALVSGSAMILAVLALPTFAFTGDQPAVGDTQKSANQQDSTPPPTFTRWMQQNYMFDEASKRQQWAEEGFTFNVYYVMDALGDITHPSGTPQQFDNWKRTRATIDLDLGKMLSAKGLSYHATGLWQNGEILGNAIGSIAHPDTLTGSHQFRLDSMWLRQKFLKDKLALTAGYVAAEDFYALQEYGSSFVIRSLNYNFQNMNTNVRASSNPNSGPGADIRIIPEKHVYVKTGYFSPPSLQTSYPTGFDYKQGSFGHTSDTEIGFYTDPDAPSTRKSYPGIIKAGFVYNGGRGFTDYKTNRTVSGNYTIYAMAFQPVYRTAAGGNRGLDVTLGINTGPQNKSKVPTEITAALIFNGPLKFRSKDGVAFGLVYSKIGSAYNKDLEAGILGPAKPGLSDEKAFEVNYKAKLTPWLIVQPIYQFYANVGGRKVGSANVAGFRIQNTF